MPQNATSQGSIRSCGDCTLCCKVLGIAAIEKPSGTWCEHCDIGHGCRIYADRPEPCRIFACWYLTSPVLPEVWNPAKSRIVLKADTAGKQLVVYVDQQRSDAWKREPYHTLLRDYAKNYYPRGGRIVVKVGDRGFVVLPDRDVDLGLCAEGEIVTCTPSFTPSGVRWEVAKTAKA